MPGAVFVISAPSGTGKTTLLKALLKGDPRLRFSISYTTRPPRPGEAPGRDYFFVSPEEFSRLREQGDLAEWVEQFGYAYGTSRKWMEQTLKQGDDLIFDIDTRGARALKASFPQAVLIFILPPSLEVLTQRLMGRGNMPSAELTRRLKQAEAELQEVPWYDYLVVNDHLDTALMQLRAVVTAARCRAALLWPQLASMFPL